MAQAGAVSTQKLIGIVSAPTGLAQGIAAVAARSGTPLASVPASQIIGANISSELTEKTAGGRYPSIHIYCERLANKLKEKFRAFSGTAQLVIEVRVSQDRIEGLESQLQLYVDAVSEVLDAHRGDWGDGVFYGGGYEVHFGAVKHGGKNFIQTAKVTVEAEVSQ